MTDDPRYRYYLTEGETPEREVAKAEFVRAERRAGFTNTMGQPAEPATAGFSRRSGGSRVTGRVEYVSPGDPVTPAEVAEILRTTPVTFKDWDQGRAGMSTPDIQYFGTSGTWVKPAGAIRVDIVLQGGQAGAVTGALMPTAGPPGGFTGAHLGTLINPNGYVVSNGEPGEIRASSFDAADLPDTVEVTVGKGGRPGGRDGYAIIVTHLAEDAGAAR